MEQIRSIQLTSIRHSGLSGVTSGAAFVTVNDTQVQEFSGSKIEAESRRPDALGYVFRWLRDEYARAYTAESLRQQWASPRRTIDEIVTDVAQRDLDRAEEGAWRSHATVKRVEYAMHLASKKGYTTGYFVESGDIGRLGATPMEVHLFGGDVYRWLTSREISAPRIERLIARLEGEPDRSAYVDADGFPALLR